MATRTAPKTTPDMERTSTSTATEKTKPPTPAPGTSKKSAREKRRVRRRGEAVDAIRLFQEALPPANDSTTSDADSDDCSTIGNTGKARAIPLRNPTGGSDPGRNLLQRESPNASSPCLTIRRRRTPAFHPSSYGKRPGGWPKRRTVPTRSPHDEGGQHQRRHPDPARLGSRLPSASPRRLRHEGTIPLVPTDGREAPQGRYPRTSPRRKWPKIWRTKDSSTHHAKGW
ncbi:hypothetical protein Trydic_g9809 [Trypoxylus dichotomus]